MWQIVITETDSTVAPGEVAPASVERYRQQFDTLDLAKVVQALNKPTRVRKTKGTKGDK